MMTELRPITGPGEYTQRNGKMAEIVGQDKDGNWLGWAVLGGAVRGLNTWKSSGEVDDDYGDADIVQPKTEIEITDELLHAVYRYGGFAIPREEVERIARSAIAWDRANRPKREPTEDEIDECRFVYCRAIDILRDAWPAAIRRAFELAQEPK